METETKRAYYSVPGCNLDVLQDRLAKLNKRCRRLGIPEIEVAIEEDYIAHQFRADGRRWWVPEVDLEATRVKAREIRARTGQDLYHETGVVMKWYEVTIRGQAPKYAGWRFIATLEPLDVEGESVNLVMRVPGEVCPNRYMRPEYVGHCDHCQLARRRKQTFVVQHDDGTIKAVGRSCLKDFLGHADPNQLAAWAELLASIDGIIGGAEDEGWLGGCGHVEEAYDLEWYLGWVAGACRHFGWVSRTSARQHPSKIATVDQVNWLLHPPCFAGYNADRLRDEWREAKEACEPIEADKAEAAAAMEWALELDLDELMGEGDNNYLANVAAVARAGYVDRKTCGLGGSIVAAYARACDKVKQAKEQAARPESKHVGKLKARGVYRVLVHRVIPTEGTFGLTLVTKMSAWDGERGCYANDLVWFATTNHGLKEFGEYEIKATVKAHGTYNDRPQTVVNRVVVVRELVA